MAFSLSQLITLGITYLIILFGSAYAAEKGWLPERLTHHPMTRILSLGVFAGAICFNGTVGLAVESGSSFLFYFLGASAAFIVAPVLLDPLSRIALTHRLGSLADVFAFRYPAPWVGGLISLLMLFGLLPLIALQIQAVAVTVHLLNQDLSEAVIAIGFCVTMTAFAILFGARHLSTRNKHQGLVVALALESVIKLCAFITVALFSVYSVFGGFSEMNQWLSNQPQYLNQSLPTQGSPRTLLLLFFAAAIAMPHVYHMLLTENDDPAPLSSARWGFPLYMLLLSLCIPPIAWAASYLGINTPADYAAMGIGLKLENAGVTMLAFIGSLAAASGVLIVSTLALAAMILNHVILPLSTSPKDQKVVKRLLASRRLLIAGIILISYAMYRLLSADQSLIGLGLVAFVAVLQFLPGLVGTFYWQRANKAGLLGGLIAGFTVWFLTLFYPLLNHLFNPEVTVYLAPDFLERALAVLTADMSYLATITSLAANIIVFIGFSLAYDPTHAERRAAEDCMSNSVARAYMGVLEARSVSEIEDRLAQILGKAASSREIGMVLAELNFPATEQRPHALNRIRNQIETNLTSNVGQTMAHRITASSIPYVVGSGSAELESIYSIENRLENFKSQLTGLAADLDALRRYHRQILQDLPIAVCSIDKNQNVLIWNRAMESLTRIPASQIVGLALRVLPNTWLALLNGFAAADETHRFGAELINDQKSLLLNLHKAAIYNVPNALGDVVIVIEDITTEQVLENQLLHSERLASIGQLAAGVAHEVGNPITGIACLAQNLLMETQEAELQEIAQQILEQTARVSAILQSLVKFAHSGTSNIQQRSIPVEIKACVDDAIQLLSLDHNNQAVEFVNSLPQRVYVLGDSQRLAQVFVNVLHNARDASTPSGKIMVEYRLSHNDLAEITISDQGHGMSSAELNQMFEPFFTSKDPGQGTGLGLAIATSIVAEHHGAIRASSAGVGLGTRITITLPHHPNEEFV
ncbi:ATP-binding protein [Pseudomonadales bacterium]|nr:ATP-binding protein [Pseudomonadales bacterium]MDB9868293.1 ATP-binding protein [Pseudomonadales bacterium]MDB9917278.1 ATP-binding protein [Pseudomonadales bacterium]